MPVYYLSTEFKGYEIVTLQTKPHMLPKLVLSEKYKLCSPPILNRDQDNVVVPPHWIYRHCRAEEKPHWWNVVLMKMWRGEKIPGGGGWGCERREGESGNGVYLGVQIEGWGGNNENINFY